MKNFVLGYYFYAVFIILVFKKNLKQTFKNEKSDFFKGKTNEYTEGG